MHRFPGALPDAAALSGNLPATQFMLVCTTFAIGAGGEVTAWIARRYRLTLAATMGAIEVAFTLYVMIAAPVHDGYPAPRSVWISGVILMIPATCLGAVIQAKHAPKMTRSLL